MNTFILKDINDRKSVAIITTPLLKPEIIAIINEVKQTEDYNWFNLTWALKEHGSTIQWFADMDSIYW